MSIKKNKKIKITELAKKLNLSISSVSRALNGYSNISKKTKVKILKAAKKYDYYPDLSAKRLASKKPNTIAFIATISPNSPDYVLLEFLAGVALGIKNTSTELLIKFALTEEDEINYYYKLINSKQADKFIFYRTKQKDYRIEMLQKNNINFVSWGRSELYKNYSWIDMDNAKSIEILMNRLIKFGHKKIAFLNVHNSLNYGYQRQVAYKKIIKINNFSYNKNYYKESINGLASKGIQLTKNLLNLDDPPTAIICSLDKYITGALKECQNRKLRVGKDISLVGYNDYDDYLNSQNITYISHPLSKMGKIAVENLKKIENGKKPKDLGILIDPILYEGNSDGPIKK